MYLIQSEDRVNEALEQLTSDQIERLFLVLATNFNTFSFSRIPKIFQHVRQGEIHIII